MADALAPKTAKDGRKLPERKTYSDNAARFKGLAADRTMKAVAAIKVVANCADPANYSYTPEQAAKVIEHLEKAVAVVKDRFANPKQPKGGDTITL